jgi:uncharacterized protein (TIGR00297 family)
LSLWLLAALGLLVNAAAAALVLWRGSVDLGGAAAGLVVGTVIFAFGGPLFWVVLMAFFISSTVLSSVGAAQKEPLKRIHQKGSRRDAFQVLANGGVGAVCALCFRLTGNPGWAIGFAVSFASSNADTWASEVGELSAREPVSLLNFRRVPRGVSGGVTLLGTSMAAAGAVFIGLVFALENLVLRAVPGGFLWVGGAVALGGFAGALLDSILGETVQAQYENHAARITERATADDGRPNRLVRGLAFVNNDVVNFASCALVTAAAVLVSPRVL